MKRYAAAAVLLVTAGVVGAVATSGGREEAAAGEPLADEKLRVTSQGKTGILGPESFCAAPNGEPIALACGGTIRAPGRAALPVRSGSRITLRLGTAADRVSVRYGRATRRGKVVGLTYSMPLRDAGEGRDWHLTMSPDPAKGRPGAIVFISALYSEPVRLRLPDRVSRPFEDASADFAIPVRASPP